MRSAHLAIKYLPNPRRKSYRLAVVVSKKVHKSAVKRNRIRRRLYEIFREHQSQFVAPHDLVCVVFSDQITTMSSQELRAVIRALLHQAGLIK